MTAINPYILLSIGLFFALLYALVITLGWAKTRNERRHFQRDAGMSSLPAFLLYKGEPDRQQSVRCVSLTQNKFLDEKGDEIEISAFDAFIAVGKEWRAYPKAKNGNLLLFEKDTLNLKYIFDIPSLKNYR